MKLLNLTLENFQGIKSAAFNFDGNGATIYGDNATGKTTVFNAMTWLLFGKPSTGAKNYTPKTKGTNGDMHHLNHEAEATFELNDGRRTTLRKVFHENYKKKRGSATETFDGHSIDFYIDGVPTKEKEYTAALLGLFQSIEKMKLLTMPDYFPEGTAWDKRREILIDMCGDVSDEDVINSKEDLKELPDFLTKPGTTDQYYTVDEYKKIAGAQKNKINKQLQEIPGRIDEAQRAIPDAIGLDANEINKTIHSLQNQKSDLETEKAQVLNGDFTTAALRQQIAEENTRLAEAKATYTANNNKINEKTYAAINSIKQDQIKAKNRLQDEKTDLEKAERNKERLNSHRNKLINEYKAVQGETWDEGNEICPTCHRPLEQDQIQKLREEFNMNKSNRLEEINKRGQQEASKEMLEEKESEIQTLEKQIRGEVFIINDCDDQIKALQKQLQTPVPFEETKEYAEIMARIAAYKEKQQSKDKTTDKLIEGLRRKIQETNEAISQQVELKSRIVVAATQQQRIKELEDQETKLSQQYETTEKGLYLCELFIKAKVALLTDKINGKFESVRFRLFIEQQNGGIKEDCEVMIPAENGRMVPFAFANNAARINAGLEIIDALSTHWNLEMPVFVDNAESVTRLKELNTQVIRLTVSEKDKELRMETADQSGEATKKGVA